MRLANLATTIAPHAAAGAIALLPALQPTLLQAHADAHAAINKQKGGATASRQSETKTLEDERDDTRRMLKCVKGFLIAEDRRSRRSGSTCPRRRDAAPPPRRTDAERVSRAAICADARRSVAPDSDKEHP